LVRHPRRIFLSLSYFGADQSQVQRYLAGGSLRASRIGLLFNALVKVPMQFLILLLGVDDFSFSTNSKSRRCFSTQPTSARRARLRSQLTTLQTQFDEIFARKREALAKTSVSAAVPAESPAARRPRPCHSRRHEEGPRTGRRQSEEQRLRLRFHHVVIHHLPHGVVGLLWR